MGHLEIVKIILLKLFRFIYPPLAQLVRARGCRRYFSHAKVCAYDALSADTVRSPAQMIDSF
jgi:hypothetical protein